MKRPGSLFTKIQAVVSYFCILDLSNAPFRFFTMADLNPDKRYYIQKTDKVVGGVKLMYAEIAIPANLNGDFQSLVWHLKEEK